MVHFMPPRTANLIKQWATNFNIVLQVRLDLFSNLVHFGNDGLRKWKVVLGGVSELKNVSQGSISDAGECRIISGQHR